MRRGGGRAAGGGAAACRGRAAAPACSGRQPACARTTISSRHTTRSPRWVGLGSATSPHCSAGVAGEAAAGPCRVQRQEHQYCWRPACRANLQLGSASVRRGFSLKARVHATAGAGAAQGAGRGKPRGDCAAARAAAPHPCLLGPHSGALRAAPPARPAADGGWAGRAGRCVGRVPRCARACRCPAGMLNSGSSLQLAPPPETVVGTWERTTAAAPHCLGHALSWVGRRWSARLHWPTSRAVPAASHAVPVPPALLKAIQDGTRTGLDAEAMQRCTYCEARAVPDADWATLVPGGSTGSGGGFLAALINPGWECEGRGDAAVQVGGGFREGWAGRQGVSKAGGTVGFLPWAAHGGLGWCPLAPPYPRQACQTTCRQTPLSPSTLALPRSAWRGCRCGAWCPAASSLSLWRSSTCRRSAGW